MKVIYNILVKMKNRFFLVGRDNSNVFNFLFVERILTNVEYFRQLNDVQLNQEITNSLENFRHQEYDPNLNEMNYVFSLAQFRRIIDLC